MTTKFLTLQSISIRPQNSTEEIMLNNISAMLLAGKKPNIRFNGTDMILEIKSENK